MIYLRNFTSGDDIAYGRIGRSEIFLLGQGSDRAFTGGGGSVFVIKEASVGMNPTRLDHDAIYSESLAGFGNRWIGGHVLLKNGHWNEYHKYDVAMNYEGRITIPANRGEKVDGEYRMHSGISDGIFIVHGGGDGSAFAWIKSFQVRGQQIAWAPETIEDISISRIVGDVTREGDHFDLNVESFYLLGDSDNPATDNQRLKIDFQFLQEVDQIHLDIDANTFAAKHEAIEDLLQHWVQTGVMLLDA